MVCAKKVFVDYFGAGGLNLVVWVDTRGFGIKIFGLHVGSQSVNYTLRNLEIVTDRWPAKVTI